MVSFNVYLDFLLFYYLVDGRKHINLVSKHFDFLKIERVSQISYKRLKTEDR